MPDTSCLVRCSFLTADDNIISKPVLAMTQRDEVFGKNHISSTESQNNETILYCYLSLSELGLWVGGNSFGQVKKLKLLQFLFMVFCRDITTTTSIVPLLPPLSCNTCALVSPLMFKTRVLQSYPFLHCRGKISIWYSSLPFLFNKSKAKLTTPKSS